jgi:hypothetical protein
MGTKLGRMTATSLRTDGLASLSHATVRNLPCHGTVGVRRSMSPTRTDSDRGLSSLYSRMKNARCCCYIGRYGTKMMASKWWWWWWWQCGKQGYQVDVDRGKPINPP